MSSCVVSQIKKPRKCKKCTCENIRKHTVNLLLKILEYCLYAIVGLLYFAAIVSTLLGLLWLLFLLALLVPFIVFFGCICCRKTFKCPRNVVEFASYGTAFSLHGMAVAVIVVWLYWPGKDYSPTVCQLTNVTSAIEEPAGSFESIACVLATVTYYINGTLEDAMLYAWGTDVDNRYHCSVDITPDDYGAEPYGSEAAFQSDISGYIGTNESFNCYYNIYHSNKAILHKYPIPYEAALYTPVCPSVVFVLCMIVFLIKWVKDKQGASKLWIWVKDKWSKIKLRNKKTMTVTTVEQELRRISETTTTREISDEANAQQSEANRPISSSQIPSEVVVVNPNMSDSTTSLYETQIISLKIEEEEDETSRKRMLGKAKKMTITNMKQELGGISETATSGQISHDDSSQQITSNSSSSRQNGEFVVMKPNLSDSTTSLYETQIISLKIEEQ